MKLKTIPRRLGFIMGAQWTRDLSWTVFTILLARHSPEILGQIVLGLTYGYLLKTIADVGLNDFLVSTFASGDGHPRELLAEVSWLKLAILCLALIIVWLISGWQDYDSGLRIVIFLIAGGLGLDAVTDSFFVLCQARGRQDVEMRIRIPSALFGIGFGIIAVIFSWSPIFIALYKPIESILCAIFASYALGRNPLGKFGIRQLSDLARRMKKGLIFTGMAICAMFYNKINVIFLKKYGGNADVGAYGVAWETIEGLSVLVSGALLGKVIFPMLARLWNQNKNEFRRLAGQTARTLWAASLPVIFLVLVESDRFLTLVYGADYAYATTSQQILAPCVATAFLHNLAAYVMICMGRHKLLFAFYLSGLILNLICCLLIIPPDPLPGTALVLTLTKVWVAILTVSFFQWKASPLDSQQWFILLACAGLSFFLWSVPLNFLHWPREAAEFTGLCPLLLLFWHWRPPSLFEKNTEKKKFPKYNST